MSAGHPLEGHDGDGAGVLGDLGLLGGDDVHDDAALEHLGHAALDAGRAGARGGVSRGVLPSRGGAHDVLLSRDLGWVAIKGRPRAGSHDAASGPAGGEVAREGAALVVELDRAAAAGCSPARWNSRIVHLRRTRRTSVTASLWKRRASCTRVQRRRDPVDERPARARSTRSASTTARGQGQLERLGEVALGLLARASPCSAGASRRLAPRRRRGAVRSPRRADRCWRARRPPRPGARARASRAASVPLEPDVQPVEPGGGVGEVPRDDDEDEEDREDPGEDARSPAAPPAQEAAPAPLRLQLRGRAALDDRLVDGHDLVGDDRPVEDPGAVPGPPRASSAAALGSSEQVDERPGEVVGLLVGEHRAGRPAVEHARERRQVAGQHAGARPPSPR